MKKGDLVKVYQKPVEQEEFEGWAVLIEEYLPDEGDGLSMWEVAFLGQHICLNPTETYLRTIYKEQ